MRHSSSGPDGPWVTLAAGIPVDGGTDCNGALANNPCSPQWFPTALAVHADDDLWGSGEGLIHWNGARWSRTTLPAPDPNAPGCGMIVHGSVAVYALGAGYSSPPSVVFGPSPSGARAQGAAVMGLNTVTVLRGGVGYSSAPDVIIAAPPVGQPATAVATIANGSVTAVNVTDFGTGYTSLPTITLSGGGGHGATARAQDLLVVDVTISNGGSGYPSYTDSYIPVTFSGGGGSGAAAFADGNCTLQGLNGMAAVREGGSFVDFAAGAYNLIDPNDNFTLLPYLLTDAGGTWKAMEARPQVGANVNIFTMAFHGATDGWIGGQVGATRAYLEHFDGTTWSEVGGSLPDGFISCVTTLGNTAWATGITSAGQSTLLECR
jgi:hypothetical protein